MVNLGTETAFQILVKALNASFGLNFNVFFHLHQRLAYDWQLTADLTRINFNADGEFNLIQEAYYFAALWQVVLRQVLKNRSRLDTHLVKSMNAEGYGKTPYYDE